MKEQKVKEKQMIERLFSRKSFVVAAAGVIAAFGAYSAMPAHADDTGKPAGEMPRPPGVPGAPGERGERQGQPGQGRGPNLEGAMKQMERSYKALARQLDDPSKDNESLRAISMLQAGAATSKAMIPHIIEEKPEAERPALTAEYRKMMLDVLKTGIELEENLLAGKREEAKASLEKLHKMEEAGHKKFAPEDHEH